MINRPFNLTTLSLLLVCIFLVVYVAINLSLMTHIDGLIQTFGAPTGSAAVGNSKP